ncbi:MAG TPA: GTP-binding protein [Herpetosiphonaceae bacterium]
MRCIAFTGFLGSGKTTAILAVAQALGERGERVAIVENERGAIGVDGPYLEAQGLGVREISDSCICCDIQSNLGHTVRLLDSLYHPTWVLVEASGVAHPDELANTIEDEDIQGALWSMVALIDAVRFDRLWPDIGGLGYLLRWQIERADVALLTKPDAVSETQLETIVGALREVRPDVTLLPIVLSQPRAGAQIVQALEALARC